MADIILVPGSFHGAWYFAPLLPALRDAGHRVFPITPTGVGDRRHLQMGAINLETHIQDVLSTVEMEDIDSAVLVGHSYGGMIITGVASRLTGRIRSLVYLDALVPEAGQSAWDLIAEETQREFLASTSDGITHTPPPDLGNRPTPHPLATYFQPVALDPTTFDVARKFYVLAEKNSAGSFEPIYQRLATEGGWEMRRLPCGHDLVHEAGDYVSELIIEAASTD